MENGTWPLLQEALRRRLNPQAYATWVSQMSCLDDNERVLRLGLPDSFSLQWVNDHYRDVLEEELRSIGPVSLEIELGPKMSDLPTTPPTLVPAPPRAESGAGSHDLVNAATRERLNPRYTFASFVPGASNELALSAARAVAESKSAVYSPLVIVGGVGLGKTHLLHAIAAELFRRQPGLRVQLRTSEQFITDVVTGIRLQRMEAVRESYRACHVLLMDDIQFISGKAACQEEFFHTFNALYDAQKQIVVTSDRLPHEIQDIEERVRTRFAWGLIADLKLPEVETRVTIVKRRAAAEGVDLPDDVATFLAQAVRSNIRELEGSLIRVQAYAALTKKPLTLALAREVLKGLVGERSRGALTHEVVLKTVAEYFDLKVADLKSPKRAKAVAFPRQIAMYLCRKHIGASYPEIGQAFGGKDHTTALNAFQRISERLEDPDVRPHVDALEQRLQD